MSSRESSEVLPSRRWILKPGAAGAVSPDATTAIDNTSSARARNEHEGIIARVNDLEHELRKVIAGDVRFDPASRLLYSTDASMYQVERSRRHPARQRRRPGGGRGGEDAARGAPAARRRHVADGQTVNRALVLDFSRYMHAVLEVNVEEQWARVQPGLVQDNLNHHVRPLGLLFGPDTSTSNRATLGGMLGNNSGGSHSIAYGLTVEHVLELTTLLADGTRVVFGEVTPTQFEAKCRASGLEGQIYREVARIRESTPGRSVRGIRSTGGASRLQPQRASARRAAQHGAAHRRLGGHTRHSTRGQDPPRAASDDDRARRHHLPRSAGGARILADDPRDRPVCGRADPTR